MRHNTVAASALLLAGFALTALLGGCADDVKDNGKEASLISEKPVTAVELPKGSGPLWPLTPGKTWRTLTIRNGKQNTNSEIRVIGAFRVPDGRTGILVHSYRDGKLFRAEVLQTDASGSMNLLALGEDEKKLLVFSPAVPLFKAPTREGEYLRWNGTAQLGKDTFPASAFHRISGVEVIQTPFTTMRAYRHDGIISLVNGTQRIDYPAVMWFVPGKGIAQRRLADRGTLALEVITKF